MNDNSKPGKITGGVCFTTEHIYTKDGVEIPYACDAQELIFKDELDQPEASFFAYVYFKKDVADAAKRPLIFMYGGGPGEAANPLNLWCPKIIDPSYTGYAAPYPELVDNPNWLIDVADIICLDPPGAGLAQVYQYEKRGKYWGVQQDAIAFIDVFKYLLTKYDRWCSPKYIAGTSYGGMRTAVLSDVLCGGPHYTEQRQYAHGIALNGAILSATALALDFSTADVSSAGVLSSTVNSLTSYAAVNWYWNRQGKPELSEFLKEAERFAADEFLRAQWLGNALAGQEREDFLNKYSYFCGLPASMLSRLQNYEIPVNLFVQQLLRERNLRVSLYDGRIARSSSDYLGFYEDYADDPVNSGDSFRKAPMVRKYFKEHLKINLDREWVEVNFDANAQWTWTSNRSMIQHLDSAMRRNPQMHALVFGGVFDLAGAVGSNRYAIRHSGIDTARLIFHESLVSGHDTAGDIDAAEEYGQCIRRLIHNSLAETSVSKCN